MKRILTIIAIISCASIVHAASVSSITKQEKTIRMSLVMTANGCLGIGYVFNGTTPAGFDNPGFTQYVYYKNHIDLPRTVETQYRLGQQIQPKQAKPGDLIFFYEDPEVRLTINHVGIYLGRDKFIHMPGEGSRITIDRIKKGSDYAKRFAAVRSYRHIFTVPDTKEDESREDVQEGVSDNENQEPNRMFETEDF